MLSGFNPVYGFTPIDPQNEPNPLGGLTPAQVRTFYGLGANPTFTINGQSYKADGTGQTIAIIDAFNDPYLASDVDTFDQTFSDGPTGSPSQYSAYGASKNWLSVLAPQGTTQISSDNMQSAPEISLDVEWAHAIAPGAKIDLVEANPLAFPNDPLSFFDATNQAANYARTLPGVSVVSMSYGTTVAGMAASGLSATQIAQLETQADQIYTTPKGHIPVTFVAATGDHGAVPSGGQRGACGGTRLPLDFAQCGGRGRDGYRH